MIERYRHLTDYTATSQYQGWLAQWEPPAATAVEQWVDTEWVPFLDGDRIQTPRQWWLTRVCTRVPFHLLDSLEIGEQACVDIGCGLNWFKRTWPRMWGVDPHNAAHRDEPWTPEWYVANWGQWPRAWTCNAIHFCDQHTIALNISKVRGILRPGGRAVIAINRARIQERTHDYDEHGLYETLCRTPGLTRMVWLDEPQDAGLDGNVWLWLRQ